MLSIALFLIDSFYRLKTQESSHNPSEMYTIKLLKYIQILYAYFIFIFPKLSSKIFSYKFDIFRIMLDTIEHRQ